MTQPATPPGPPLYTLRSLSSSGLELLFYGVQRRGETFILMRAQRPNYPDEQPHQAQLSLPDFESLVDALQRAGDARPTLDFTGGQVNLHLTTRSRRPGRLSVRSDANPEVLNYSTLNPIAEDFQRVAELARQTDEEGK